MHQTPTNAGSPVINGGSPDLHLIPLPEVERLTARRKTAIYADLANPDSDFPKPVRVGRSVRWVKEEIANWIERRISERDAQNEQVAA